MRYGKTLFHTERPWYKAVWNGKERTGWTWAAYLPTGPVWCESWERSQPLENMKFMPSTVAVLCCGIMGAGAMCPQACWSTPEGKNWKLPGKMCWTLWRTMWRTLRESPVVRAGPPAGLRG